MKSILSVACLLLMTVPVLAGCGAHYRPGNYYTRPIHRHRHPVTQANAIGATTRFVTGAYVKDVACDGPAEEAGLEVGDVIVKFRGRPVRSSAALNSLVRQVGPGRKATLTYLRKNREVQTKIEVRNRFKGYAEGVEILAPDLGLEATRVHGAFVVGVWKGWPARHDLRLRVGDIITSLAGTPIRDPKAMSRALASTRAGVPVTIMYLSCGTMYIRDVATRGMHLDRRGNRIRRP